MLLRHKDKLIFHADYLNSETLWKRVHRKICVWRRLMWFIFPHNCLCGQQHILRRETCPPHPRPELRTRYWHGTASGTRSKFGLGAEWLWRIVNPNYQWMCKRFILFLQKKYKCDDISIWDLRVPYAQCAKPKKNISTILAQLQRRLNTKHVTFISKSNV